MTVQDRTRRRRWRQAPVFSARQGLSPGFGRSTRYALDV